VSAERDLEKLLDAEVWRNRVYLERQQEKELRKKYRAHASDAYGNDIIKINEHANVQMMEDGAFVEATIWISKKDVE
jgi:hypothetical protein